MYFGFINHDKNIFSRKLPFDSQIFTSTYNDVSIQILFSYCARKTTLNEDVWNNFSLARFLTFVATYFQINHERNINSAAFNIRIFLNHFAFAISFRLHKSRERYACGKEVFIDFINLSAKSSVSNNLWKQKFRLAEDNFVCMWTHASSSSWFLSITK